MNNIDKYELFDEHCKKVAAQFHNTDKNATIRLISHLDADGISSCSILVRLLNMENRKYSLSIIQQLKEDTLKEIANEPYPIVMFTDLASGMVPTVAQHLSDKTVFILDHHELPDQYSNYPHVHMINPHEFDIDGGREVSGSGVAYYFSKAVNQNMKKHAHIAVIGAIGDMQEDNGFHGLNKKIVNEAVEQGSIKIKRGLRLFGAQTKPLHKVLEYCTNPYIPGVSGSESGVIQFLQQCGINPKKEKGWKKVGDLTDEEMKAMVTGVIMRRLGEGSPDDVLGNVYLLKNEEEGSPLKDVKEFSTLLNACGRLGKASLGIGACIGDKTDKQRAIKALDEYKRHIINALNWYKENKDSKYISQKEGYMIINSEDFILPTIIGTLASIVSRSKEIADGTYIFSLARLIDDTTKASIRISGIRDDPNVDLKHTMDQIMAGVDGECGGHKHAAGAVFSTAVEAQVLENAHRVLGGLAIEEKV